MGASSPMGQAQLGGSSRLGRPQRGAGPWRGKEAHACGGRWLDVGLACPRSTQAGGSRSLIVSSNSNWTGQSVAVIGKKQDSGSWVERRRLESRDLRLRDLRGSGMGGGAATDLGGGDVP